jgi:hypothetical protein
MMLRTSVGWSVVAVAVLLYGTAHAARAGQTKPAAAPEGVNVTVKYGGKGAVDANHRLWVWLFTSPDIGPGSIPIAEQSLEKNGATAAFGNVGAKEVFIAIAYDEQGGFLGSAPPPVGSPVQFYGAKGPEGKPVPVIPGAKGSVTVTLTDAQRMQ